MTGISAGQAVTSRAVMGGGSGAVTSVTPRQSHHLEPLVIHSHITYITYLISLYAYARGKVFMIQNDRPNTVYYIKCKQECLWYVGVSLDVDARIDSHLATMPDEWAVSFGYVSMKHFSTRREALDFERLEIERLLPPLNRQHNSRWPQPGRTHSERWDRFVGLYASERGDFPCGHVEGWR